MTKNIAILIFMLVFSVADAQKSTGYLEIVKSETRLKAMFDSLYMPLKNNDDKTALLNQIDSVFYAALSVPGSFDYKWDMLDMIGRLKSDNDEIKVFSWLYMFNRNEYSYRAYIQLKEKDGDSKIFKLKRGNADDIKSENYSQNINDWHGKVYYDIITASEKRRTYYTLLGYDPNNIHSAIKTIEVITVRRGKPVFLDQRILDNGKVKNRLVLEYSAEVSISLRYNQELKMIVFDHLAPLHPLYHGNFQFYGPDGSYDGMRFIDGVWVREDDVDARNY